MSVLAGNDPTPKQSGDTPQHSFHPSDRRIRVFIAQPVLAHYRLPLFDGLNSSGEFDVRVFASSNIAGFPSSVPSPPSWADTDHPAINLGDRLYWQRGMYLPRDFGRGDVLVIDANPRFLSNLRLLSDARRRALGVISWGHGWSPTSKRWRARIRYRYMASADVVLVYTEDEIRDLEYDRTWRIPILATNNALDESRFTTAAAAWPRERLQQFATANRLDGHHVLLFCGRLRSNPSTELDVAIRALAQLHQRGGRYLLAVVGSGEAERPLRALATRLRVDHLLRWIGAVYAEHDLAPWFLTAQCFVYPGAIGLSLLHAFGYGLPTITHDVRRLHNPEIAALRNGENGFLFRKGDAGALAEKVAVICNDPALRTRMSERARLTVSSEFCMRGMIARFSAAIRLASQIATTQAS